MCLCWCCTLFFCGSSEKAYWQQSRRVLFLSTYTVSAPKQHQLSFGSTAVHCQRYQGWECQSVPLKCKWAEMLHRSVTKCCLFHYGFIAQTSTSFEKFQKAFYFLSLFTFPGFCLFTLLCLGRILSLAWARGRTGTRIAQELAWMRSSRDFWWSTWGYLLFFCWNVC